MTPDVPFDPAPSAPRRGTWLWPSIALLLVTAGQVIALRIEGQPWWCKCGQPFLFSGDINTMHNSQHVIDPYTISHVLHGLVFFFFVLQWAATWFRRGLSLPWMLVIAAAIEVAWEVVENSPIVIDRYRAATIALGYEGDTVANSVSDLVAAIIGFVIAWKIGWKGSIALFVASELLMLWWIRDNLTLNVLMLLYPIDAVRQWQSGLT